MLVFKLLSYINVTVLLMEVSLFRIHNKTIPRMSKVGNKHGVFVTICRRKRKINGVHTHTAYFLKIVLFADDT